MAEKGSCLVTPPPVTLPDQSRSNSALNAVIRHVLIGCALTLGTAGVFGAAAQEFIIVQSTTSTENSGLYDWILPQYTRKSGIAVKVVSVGTGQAIRNAQNCDGDLLIVHSTRDEVSFVKNGYGTARHDLMYNDFVIIGPQDDPANLKLAKTVSESLQKIVASEAKFASRGDNSGTHKAERRLWAAAGISADGVKGGWYLETGLGMGATLNFAVQTGAYTMSDRATWLAFQNKADHVILFQGDPPLFNQYGVVPVSKRHCPKAKAALALDFTQWLLGPEGQAAIANYRRNGAQLFFPNATP